jgi:hypothetical protein
VVLVKLPLIPFTVTVLVPVVAVLLADNVNALVVVVLEGLKLAVTPEGNPEADKLTLLLKPLTGLTVMVLTALVPCTTVKLLGDADSEKLGGALMMSVTVVLCNRPPLVPVTVKV